MLDALSFTEHEGARVRDSQMSTQLRQHARYIVGGLLALVVRVSIVSQSIGSNDARTWEELANYIAQHGLSGPTATLTTSTIHR